MGNELSDIINFLELTGLHLYVLLLLLLNLLLGLLDLPRLLGLPFLFLSLTFGEFNFALFL
jgi:hypothetical protein